MTTGQVPWHLLPKVVVTLALVAYLMVSASDETAALVLAALLAYWFRETEHLVASHTHRKAAATAAELVSRSAEVAELSDAEVLQLRQALDEHRPARHVPVLRGGRHLVVDNDTGATVADLPSRVRAHERAAALNRQDAA